METNSRLTKASPSVIGNPTFEVAMQHFVRSASNAFREAPRFLTFARAGMPRTLKLKNTKTTTKTV